MSGNVKKNLQIILAAVFGMIVFTSILGKVRVNISAFEVELALGFFDHGFTQLEVPPIGKVFARTHLPPYKIEIILRSLNIAQLEDIIPLLSDEEFLSSFLDEAKRKIYIIISRLFLIAFIGGATGVGLLLSKRKKDILVGGLIGLLTLAIILTSIYITFDANAFLYPEFEGLLKAAPWMFGLAEETIGKVVSLGEQLQTISTNLYILFERLELLEPLGSVDGDIKIMHVSDIHNSSAAVVFMEQVIKDFNIDLVIDTGDITDFGTPLEAELISKINSFPVPYVFLPGNHDSPEVINFLHDLENVIVLEEGAVEIENLLITGISDPSGNTNEMTVANRGTMEEYADRLEEIIKDQDRIPNIVASHNRQITDRFIGKVPLILIGHTHQLLIEEINDTIIINAGTTGAAGIRGLEAAREIPFSVVVIHYMETPEGLIPIAADTIRVFQFQSSFSLDRTIFFDVSTEEDDDGDNDLLDDTNNYEDSEKDTG